MLLRGDLLLINLLKSLRQIQHDLCIRWNKKSTRKENQEDDKVSAECENTHKDAA